jgi:hypothetical protein
MRRYILIFLLLVGSFVTGFHVRHLIAESELPGTRYSCQSIARSHQDYLMSEYDIDPGFNTDQNNPRRDINQRASDLNAQLLNICETSPIAN